MKGIARFVVMLSILICNQVKAGDDDCGGAVGAFDKANFEVAESLAAKNARGDDMESCSRVAGDAALMRGNSNFYQYYARAYAEDLDTSLYLTKGDSPIFKVLAAATMVLGVAADYGNAQQGIQSNNTVVAYDTARRMNASLTSTIGTPEYRKIVSTTMKDLKKISKGKAGVYPIVFPWHRNMPGASMVRIHVGTQVCNGSRIDNTTFVTSRECFESGGSAEGSFITKQAALMDTEIAKIQSTSIRDNKWMLIHIANEERMAKYGKGDSPFTAKNYSHSDNNQHAVTWFSDDFSKVVIYVKFCKHPKMADCAEEIRNGAHVWVRPEVRKDSWFWAGQGLSDGTYQTTTWN